MVLTKSLYEEQDEDWYLLVASASKDGVNPEKALAEFRSMAAKGKVSPIFQFDDTIDELSRKSNAIDAEIKELESYVREDRELDITKCLEVIKEKLTRNNAFLKIPNHKSLFDSSFIKDCYFYRDTTNEDGFTEVMFERDVEYLYLLIWE